MAGPFKMKGSKFYGHGNQSPVKDEQPHKTTKDHKPHATFSYEGSDEGKTYAESETAEKQHAESQKILYGPRHGTKLKDKKGWTKTKGTNTWTNDAYEEIQREKKALKARYKVD
tara:strand:+ start:157 stop:498 length:342 start_codon:yes stop_codon:yes gene_type:complete